MFRSVVPGHLRSVMKKAPILKPLVKHKVIQRRASKASSECAGIDDFEQLSAVTENEAQVKVGLLEKLQSCEVDFQLPWEQRAVRLSKTMLSFTLPDSCKLADCVPVCEISHVSALKIHGGSHSYRPNDQEEWSRHSIWENHKDDGSENWFVFAVYTIDHGFNAGRTYFLRAQSDDDREEWIDAVRKMAKSALRERQMKMLSEMTTITRMKHQADQIYQSSVIQNSLAVLIAANFFMNCLQAQLYPSSLDSPSSFTIADNAFTTIFLIDLCVNMFAHWFWCAPPASRLRACPRSVGVPAREFWTGPQWKWNMFDLVGAPPSPAALAAALPRLWPLPRTSSSSPPQEPARPITPPAHACARAPPPRPRRLAAAHRLQRRLCASDFRPLADSDSESLTDSESLADSESRADSEASRPAASNRRAACPRAAPPPKRGRETESRRRTGRIRPEAESRAPTRICRCRPPSALPPDDSPARGGHAMVRCAMPWSGAPCHGPI